MRLYILKFHPSADWSRPPARARGREMPPAGERTLRVGDPRVAIKIAGLSQASAVNLGGVEDWRIGCQHVARCSIATGRFALNVTAPSVLPAKAPGVVMVEGRAGSAYVPAVDPRLPPLPLLTAWSRWALARLVEVIVT